MESAGLVLDALGRVRDMVRRRTQKNCRRTNCGFIPNLILLGWWHLSARCRILISPVWMERPQLWCAGWLACTFRTCRLIRRTTRLGHR